LAVALVAAVSTACGSGGSGTSAQTGAATQSSASAGAPGTLAGAFALPGKSQHVDAKLVASFQGDQEAKLDLSETQRPGGALVTNYDTDMTKKLHMIVISDDLTTFQHVHPTLGPDGHFTIDLKVPAAGGYHVYADGVPHGDGQQVFRFDVPFGNTLSNAPNLTATPATVQAGPYTVKLSTLQLNSGESTMLVARLTKRGQPAQDLQPYLGGAAHAVFINAKDYSYIHVHPTQGTDMVKMDAMNGMGGMKELPDNGKVNPVLMLHVVAPEAGTYKLWLQFRGGGRLYVAPFVLTAP
jgi:hypothetical protein